MTPSAAPRLARSQFKARQDTESRSKDESHRDEQRCAARDDVRHPQQRKADRKCEVPPAEPPTYAGKRLHASILSRLYSVRESLQRELGRTHQELVDVVSRLTAFCDCPHDQGLPAPCISGRKYARHRRHVRFV